MKRSSSPLPAAEAAPGKKKRRSQPMGNLTNLQKRQLCVKFSQVKMTQQELCQWAKREFQLAHLPHQSTISKILARADELTQMAPRDLLARRKGLVTHPELDTALCNWVLCARANGLKISGDIIKTQARVLAAQLGVASTAASHIALGLDLTNVRLEILPPSMEPMQVPINTAANAVMDSSDLASASASIAETALGETSIPDSTQSLTQQEVPQTEPLAQSQSHISAQDATVAIDSATLPTMPTTMQPMDAGIIMAFKRRYRRYHMLYALDRHEAGRQDVFHVGQLQAMRWARHCWKQELSEDVIRKCWAVTEIVTPKPTPETLTAFETIEEDIDKEICDTVQLLNILRPLLIDDFVSPRDENVEIHCSGSDESDFMYTVPDVYAGETKNNDKKFSADNTDMIQQQQPTIPNELTPRLQELHARIEASASSVAAISAVSLTTSVNAVIGESTGAISASSGTAVDVLGLSASGLTAEGISDAPASNEQLIDCFKTM
ncbi:hypothetical protein BBO99_00006604 [Phytophthora kernoviae]|uniref:Uncharacterized protein n=1 Tax=Phytophthora kernoviae TaxID=325452 RepID=A0A421GKV9_9STRA|nr:hypothetical protein BBO99_00006604 [Phytophthora kernoviae]